ncbi:phosphoglycerol transferase MdoB-like AlkP superfamily enzyme [Peteryoungia aggregata LMG 23059]|uniref:Phosphoglycerol transferase MdoB-like AlkP superfamily enzyme n=1 Tax=Peteryoungia aggregata LMG 23059 TaxID=1368425 RepID=A0ABU0G7Q6_9HYPH|nr:DUF4405 domain-containing protein [Peteryoungia aggregata]MDQ0421370.1 phosphoglycerol transferase MdoB-like AlkP superfamily enzyme [Peteryoungia aggregata LMG 23059]
MFNDRGFPMPSLLSRYATPFTTGLFLISLISGIALFFHVGTTAFREMHEWLSMVLFLPFVLHVWKNWRPFLAYFKRLPMALSLAICLIAGLVFAWPAITGDTSSASSNPAFAMVNIVAAATPAEVAPLLGKSNADIVTALKEAGFTTVDPSKPLSEIATASGKDTMELMATLTALKAK